MKSRLFLAEREEFTTAELGLTPLTLYLSLGRN